MVFFGVVSMSDDLIVEEIAIKKRLFAPLSSHLRPCTLRLIVNVMIFIHHWTEINVKSLAKHFHDGEKVGD